MTVIWSHETKDSSESQILLKIADFNSAFPQGEACDRFFPCYSPLTVHHLIAISHSPVNTVTRSGCVTAGSVSHWIITEEVQVQSQGGPCGICGGQSGNGTGFAERTSVYSDDHHSANAPNSTVITIIIRGGAGPLLEPGGSLPCSQKSFTGPWLQTDESIPHSTYYFKVHFNIILPPTPRSPKGSFPFRFPDQYLVRIYLFHACYTFLPAH
jgi:hypothetical protein